MKGIIFTEFLEFVTSRSGENMVDDLLDECDLPSGGVYTAVGTYDHGEIVTLLGAFCRRTGIAPADALSAFGSRLAERFAVLYSGFFTARSTLFAFLASVDDHIHVEVRKLYPDAQLPEFSTLIDDAGRMVMRYRSERHFDMLAEGLIRGAARHYNVSIDIARTNGNDLCGDYTEFTIAITGRTGAQAAA